MAVVGAVEADAAIVSQATHSVAAFCWDSCLADSMVIDGNRMAFVVAWHRAFAPMRWPAYSRMRAIWVHCTTHGK